MGSRYEAGRYSDGHGGGQAFDAACRLSEVADGFIDFVFNGGSDFVIVGVVDWRGGGPGAVGIGGGVGRDANGRR